MLKKLGNVIVPQVLADGTIRLRVDLTQDKNSADDLKTIYKMREQETVVYVVPVEASELMDKLLEEVEETR